MGFGVGGGEADNKKILIFEKKFKLTETNVNYSLDLKTIHIKEERKKSQKCSSSLGRE